MASTQPVVTAGLRIEFIQQRHRLGTIATLIDPQPNPHTPTKTLYSHFSKEVFTSQQLLVPNRFYLDSTGFRKSFYKTSLSLLKFRFHKILILGFSCNIERHFSSSYLCNYFIPLCYLFCAILYSNRQRMN